MIKNFEKKNKKEKEENIWKRKSGKTFGEKNMYIAENEKSEEGKGGRVDGRKIFYVEEKKKEKDTEENIVPFID